MADSKDRVWRESPSVGSVVYNCPLAAVYPSCCVLMLLEITSLSNLLKQFLYRSVSYTETLLRCLNVLVKLIWMYRLKCIR